MNLKTRHIMGPRKHAEDPVVIPEEDTSIRSSWSAKRMKSYDEICKGLSQ